MHDHITSLVVFDNTYIFLIISDVRKYKYFIRYSSFRSMYYTTTCEDLTRYLLHLNTGLHAASNIKPSKIVDITSRMI